MRTGNGKAGPDPAAAAAFESFYREHVTGVYQYALAVLANPADAEDVTQQTFLNAYRALQRGDRPHTPHNWLIKIAHNVCRMRWRQSARRPQELPLEGVREPVMHDEERPSLDEVLTALTRLPFNQRAAIVMRELEDRSYADIADVLGTSVSAVEALLFRARTNLRAGRKALRALTLVPVPGSLSSFFGSGSGGIVAAGGTALGADLVLKAVAVVATGVVVGGLGYKSASTVATARPSSASLSQRAHGGPLSASPNQRLASAAADKAAANARASGARSALGPQATGHPNLHDPDAGSSGDVLPTDAPALGATPGEAPVAAAAGDAAPATPETAPVPAVTAPAPPAAPAIDAPAPADTVVAVVPLPPPPPAPLPVEPPPLTVPTLTVTVPSVTLDVPTVK